MKNLWELSLALSFALHAIVLFAVFQFVSPDRFVQDKPEQKEIEITPLILPPSQTRKPPIDGQKILDTTPPPYLPADTEKIILDKDTTLNKPHIMENFAKTVVFALPREEELKKNPAYMDYYRLIREKIKNNAYLLYESGSAGEVIVSFIVTKDGKLDSLAVQESLVTNQKLIETALQSIKDAAPFLPFPDELPYPKLQFNISIYFKNN